MLVLSSRCNEKIVFPGLDITVQILQIKGHQIKIGIDAPSSVTILREELEHASFHTANDLLMDEFLPPLPHKG